MTMGMCGIETSIHGSVWLLSYISEDQEREILILDKIWLEPLSPKSLMNHLPAMSHRKELTSGPPKLIRTKD